MNRGGIIIPGLAARWQEFQQGNFVIAGSLCFDNFAARFTGILIKNHFMSQHRSLRAAASLGGKRNVLKRFERVELLKKRGQWKEGDRVTGLRKTKAGV
jgi:small basic protein (TIGR04137 family)